MRGKLDAKFIFTCSDKVISGIAFKENEGVVASFKLRKVSDARAEGGKTNILILKIVFNNLGREIYDAFHRIFLEESQCYSKQMVITDRYAEFHLQLNDKELEKIMEKVKSLLSHNLP